MKTRDDSNASNQGEGRKKNTFIVKIEYCQHETWQGQVIWAEEEKTQRFRSALELIKLMDEAMAAGAEVQVQDDIAKTS